MKYLPFPQSLASGTEMRGSDAAAAAEEGRAAENITTASLAPLCQS